MTKDTLTLGSKYRKLKDNFAELNKSYEFLLENNNALLASNQNENKKLMDRLNKLQVELQAKEDSLNTEQDRMAYLSQELQKREARVYELESLISRKDSTVNYVRKRISDALLNFNGKGLTIEQRNGKVYVSLENSLLFPSASWTVDQKGKQALEQLAVVLAENPDLNVMVEGHTDNDEFNGRTAVKDNWDLSVMRATSIVKILTANPGVDPKKITAAGRSEYLPLVPNDSPEGKAKNRRTDIIITPNLGELVDLLEEVK
ncbi:MAG TPA: cell envelope biogenesis protein OmpA [Cryomorphaceae bacterium]|nr:cell envelope biogenesis protein OmpA [Cryomorphaceae bacterium]